MDELDNIINDFATQLFALLVNIMPVDTGNMVSHTKIINKGDSIDIVITAPTAKGVDYASFVNENPQRTAKEQKNFHYVQKCIEQTARIIALKYGGKTNV